MLEDLGAVLHPGVEFPAGTQYTQVQNGTPAVLPADEGCGVTARELNRSCLGILAAAGSGNQAVAASNAVNTAGPCFR